MRYVLSFLVLILSVLAAPVSAQKDELPECAATCFSSALANQTTCSPTDTPCICESRSLNSAIEQCTLESCSVIEGLQAMNATETLCDRPVRNQSHILVYSATVLGSFAFVAVAVRVSVAVRQNSFGADDLCACLASCVAVPNFIGLTLSAKFGLGRDMWTLTAWEIRRVLKTIYICQNFYFWCSGFTKLTFLFFFLRIFPDERTRRWVYLGIALSLGYAAGFGFPMTFACWPIPAIWTTWDGEHPQPRYCINQNLFYYCAAGVNISTDILIAVIPIPELWKLNLSVKRKMFLSAIFSVGFITIIVSCIRVQSLAQYASTTNPIYDTLSSATWSVIELNVGVICVCMPSFRRFLAHALPRCFRLSEDNSDPHAAQDPPGKIVAGGSSTLSAGKRSGKKRSTLPGSLFETNITKTVDTRVEETTGKGDDEVGLVELREGRDEGESSVNRGGSQEEGGGVESLYRAQHKKTIPKEW